MELAIMHIDNRVKSLEDARNCLDLMCNNQYVIILLTEFLKVCVLINFLFSFFYSASGTNQGAIDNRIEQAMVRKTFYCQVSRLYKYRN